MEIREALVRETRHAARSLARTPSFSVIAVLTLALGIGGTTAIFAVLDAVVLRPLPYANADRLVELSSPVPLLKGQTRWGLGRHEMFYFLENGRTLDNLGVYQLSNVNVLGSGSGERSARVQWAQTSASLFNVLGFTAEHGRLILPEDNSHEMPTVAVLGHDFWMRRFAGDSGVVSRALNVEGLPLTIVGVLPRGADLPDLKVDVWAPAHVDSTTVWNNHTWSAIGRLAPGFTAADAERELAPLTARLPEAFPRVYGRRFITSTGFRTAVQPLRDAVVGETVTRGLWAVFGAVGLVLLIATANVANLFLVRHDARRREVAMRTALGADRAHLAWYFLAESALLASVAGALGIAIAQVMLRLILAVAPAELPRLSEVQLTATAMAFGLGIAALLTLVFGLLPLAGARFDLAMLRDSGRGLTWSRARMAARRALVMAQMALAVVLLSSTTLMVRTYQNLRAVQPGFDPSRVLTMEIALPEMRYNREPIVASGFFEQLTNRLRGLPGTVNVGFSEDLPLLSGDGCTGVTLEGPTPEQATGACPPVSLISPGYFETMGIQVAGRTPDWAGMNAGDGAMVVSKAFAEHWWPDENPIGKGLRFNGTRPPFYRVVGVSDDVRGNGVDAPPTELVYFPMRPIPGAPLWTSPTFMHLVLRTEMSNPVALTNSVTRIVEELEPQATVANAQSMETVVAKSIARRSFTMVLLAITAVLALLLSAVGIYGVISYIVTQQRGEIGVRIALGARVRQVTQMVLRESLSLAILGVLIGVAASIATTRVLAALLFGVAPTDTATLVLVPLLLIAVALLASYAPARRAARINPVEALRTE